MGWRYSIGKSPCQCKAQQGQCVWANPGSTMDEVALAGLLQTTKFVQTLHSYVPKALVWDIRVFGLGIYLFWVTYCGGGQLVISPLMGTGTVFWHRLEIARRDIAHRREASFLHNASLGFPSSRCHACSIERPAIWHTFIPSTLSAVVDPSMYLDTRTREGLDRVGEDVGPSW